MHSAASSVKEQFSVKNLKKTLAESVLGSTFAAVQHEGHFSAGILAKEKAVRGTYSRNPPFSKSCSPPPRHPPRGM